MIRALARRLGRLRRRLARAAAPREFRRICKQQALYDPAPSLGAARLDLRESGLVDHDNGRYLYLLTQFLLLGGLEVEVVERRWTPYAFLNRKFPRLILDRRAIRFVRAVGDQQPAPGPDGGGVITLDGGARRISLRLGLDLAQRAGSYDLLFPYTLHPLYYEDGSYLDVPRLRSVARTRRVVFSGNMDPASYGATDLEGRFGKLPRPVVIELLRQELGPAEMRVIDHPDGFRRVQAEDAHRFVLIQTGAGFRVPKEEWLGYLAGSDFFLACPGLDMPLAHNLVEAMSVGTIPLTEYPEYFDPPLRDGHDCVVYAGRRDLVSVMRRVLSLDEASIARMREHVIQRYDRFHTPTAFVGQLGSLPLGGATIGLNFLPAPTP